MLDLLRMLHGQLGAKLQCVNHIHSIGVVFHLASFVYIAKSCHFVLFVSIRVGILLSVAPTAVPESITDVARVS